MEDVSEAKSLIKEIRAAKRVDEGGGNDENANDLQHALRMLSEELYSKPTHFILELIQNADDNKYAADATPHLTIVYRNDGFLWIGCNELGFTPSNVRAICRIGGSTKKVEDSRKGYIGEKGIGFKSVFKVADVVWISSGALQFQFDKTKALGMIAPEWCNFEHNELITEQTKFCFRIPNEKDRKLVERDLLSLKAELLLFLRQLRSIDIKMQNSSGAVEESSHLSRVDGEENAVKVTSLSNTATTSGTTSSAISSAPAEETTRYMVLDRTINKMPQENKRPGVTSSDVVIAFPITEDFEPLVQSCQTYNFLPVRDYGLPFVLQGDFILAANREDVLQANDWNRAVISGAFDLFIKSIHVFNRHNIVKYTWPRYLASQGKAYGTAFTGFIDRLVTNLRTEAIIESCDMTMETPLVIEYMPEPYKDASDPPQPLVCGRSGMRAYAGPRYSIDDLAKLKIQVVSEEAFLGLVKKFIAGGYATFKELPAAWHSRLAKALCSIDAGKLSDLRVVPLRSGAWMSASSGKASSNGLFFPGIGNAKNDGLNIPLGISLNIIEDAAATDRLRSKLFKHLGARKLGFDEVYRAILDQHRAHGREYGAWTMENLVEHAWFLFTSPVNPRGCDVKTALRVASRNSPFLSSGPELYMDDPQSDFRIAKYFGAENKHIRYIHEKYLTYADDKGNLRAEEWLDWLQKRLGIRTVPRLTHEGKFSPEFEELINQRLNNEWLHVLKAKWTHYSVEISNSRGLQDALSKSKVKCMDGFHRALKDSYLATDSVLEEPLAQGRIPLLDVDDSKAEIWSKFTILGLNTSPNLRLYLTVLRTLRTASHHNYSVQDVRRLYSQINRLFGQDQALVRAAFQNEPLVYIEASELNPWWRLDDCWWSAPDCLRGRPKLETRYAKLKDFFLDKLGLKEATVTDVANELKQLSGREQQIPAIKELLLYLGSSVRKNQWDSRISKEIYDRIIFPVKNISKSLRSGLNDDWFLPDKEKLRDIFQDKVALLDFNHGEIQHLLPLFESLMMRSRFLSVASREKNEVLGASTYNALSTDRLRLKAFHISCLVDASERDHVFQEISNIKVKYSSQLILRHFVNIHERPTYGKNEAGWLVVAREKDTLVVYFSAQFTEKNGEPFPELADRLITKFNIPKTMEGVLLTILISDNDKMVERQMERHGINVPERAPPTVERKDTHTKSSEAQISRDGASKKIDELQNRREVEIDRSTSQDSASSSSEASVDGDLSGQPNPLLSQAVRQATPARIVNRENIAPSLLSDVTTFRIGASLGASHDKSSKADNGAAVVSIRKALDLSAFPALNGGAARTVSVSGSTAAVRVTKPSTLTRDAPTEFQQDVGRAGEFFIYEWLKSTIQAGDECWTSSLRVHYGLSPFGGDEYDHADFTIDDRETANRLGNWLAENKCIVPKTVNGMQVTYHLEVKTTTGAVNEPFTMSANQIRLATEWHKSDSDVCVILRVFHFESSTPSIQAYVDPIGLKVANKMSIIPDRYIVETK